VIRQSVTAAILAGALILGSELTAQSAVVRPVAGAGAAAGAAAGTASRRSRPFPDGGAAKLSGAALASAANRCAAWAARAGFANDGYLAGSLTTAVAVALAESGCDPAACNDNTPPRVGPCPKSIPPGDSVDRGAWQLNNLVKRAASNACAFSGPCSARAAYNVESDDGTFFAAWVTYLENVATRFIPAAQVAVNALRAGTVTNGLVGSCLGYPGNKAGAAAILENCGSAAADQQWTVKGSTLRTSSGLCLAASSRRKAGPAVLRRCSASALQKWLAHAGAALYNPAARRCLTDPGAAIKPGAVIGAFACSGQRDQSWFRP
jgi:Ricin-type beta-trefoil lectin domain/Lysozyme like domain